MQDIVYSEWVPAGAFVKIMVGFVSLIVLCMLFITIAVGVIIWISISLSALVPLLLLFWNYRGIKIQVTTRELLISYGYFNRKRFAIGDIASCKPVKASFRRYWGVGVRYGVDGSWAYTTSFGNAVEVIPKKGRAFVFSSNTPEKICNLIAQVKNLA